MKKNYFLAVTFTSLLLTSCQEEQIYCCDSQINDWVKHNLKEIRQISRSTWITLPENLKNPVFGAFTPQQKIIFWEEIWDNLFPLNEVLDITYRNMV